jgi:hypothetical protein
LSSDGPILGSRECIFELSKKMTNGQMRRIGEPRSYTCDSPSCKSFKGEHNFFCILKTNKECDSKMATIVDGTLTSEIVHGLIINGEGRGAHHGKFRIGGSKDIEVVGILGGITNAGTHHGTKDCEPCDIKGHMEGRLVGNIEKGPLIGSRIIASYMIFFEHSPEFTDTIANGELEGIIVSDCT